MLDSSIKSIIDNARNVLVGKVPNPVSQIDLITIAMIYKFMDDMDNSIIQKGGKASFFKGKLAPYAWHKLMKPSLGNDNRITHYSEALEKLPLSENIPELFRQIFKGAFLPYRDGATLTMFLKEINKLSYDNSENLGNGFEYLLSIMGSQGDAGQFRTPRHIIDFIVEVVNPDKSDTILDPACGTAGFLISAFKYIIKLYTKELSGDKLTPTEKIKLTQNIKGYDISPDMQKLALVNLYLHGFKSPNIIEYDTLTQETKWNEKFDVILANPPFMTPKGGIKPHKKFSINANRSEVLFVDYILDHLNLKGKAGIIVPEGIIFQSATAYQKLRKKLIDENYLYAVVSLPSGVFQPYSGVKTSILFIDKELAKKSDSILFVNIENDGFDLGAQRKAIEKNDLPEALEAIKKFRSSVLTNEKQSPESENPKPNPISNIVKKTKITENDYNLSGQRYIETVDYSNCKWENIELEKVCLKVTDGSHFSPQTTAQGYPYITVKDIDDDIIDFTNCKFIEKCDYMALVKNGCKPSYNDILFSKDGTVGKVSIVNHKKDFVVLSSLAIITPDQDKIIPKYLKSILKSSTFVRTAIKNKSGVAIKRIILKTLKAIKIPLPPLDVQEEIVKELDTYQAVIDGAKKVVQNWKPTIPTNPDWQKVKLIDVCEQLYAGGDVPKNVWSKCQTEDYTIPIYSNGIGDKALYGFTNIAKTCKDAVTISARGTIGYTEIRKAPFYPAIRLIVAIPKHQILILKYLHLVLKNSNIYGNGNSIPQLTIPMIKEILIPLPPLSEQQKIVAKIEEEEKAIEHCKKLIAIHEAKIADKIKSLWGESCEDQLKL